MEMYTQQVLVAVQAYIKTLHQVRPYYVFGAWKTTCTVNHKLKQQHKSVIRVLKCA